MPENITDVSTFTAPIVGPADADPADRTYVMTIAQGLANRTRYLSDERDRLQGYIGGATGDDDWAYQNPRVRSFLVDLSDGNPGGSGWTYSTIGCTWSSAPDNGRLVFPVRVPHGASILKLFAYVTPGTARATAGDRVRIGCTITELDNSLSPSPIAADIQLGDTDDGSTSDQVLEFTPGAPIVVDRYAGQQTYLGWVDSGNGGSSDSVWGFGVTVSLPGPPEL